MSFFSLSLLTLPLGKSLYYKLIYNFFLLSKEMRITMKINEANRPAAAKVYTDYRGPFLEQIPGALTKDLLIRDEDVQVLHGFDSVEHAQAYLTSEMFQNDVFVGLKPLWDADPDVKIYTVA